MSKKKEISEKSGHFVRQKISPKKHLSQNFLVNENAIKQIIESVGSVKSGTIVECGVGAGALTIPLARKYPKIPIVGVDIDLRCVTKLRAETKDYPNLKIFQADLCADEFLHLLSSVSEPITFVGNLPYHVASQIMLRLLQVWPRTAKIVFMLQKEFAERIRANPADEQFGKLSVLFQNYYDVHKAIMLNPASFFPKPTVQSEVLVMTPRAAPFVTFDKMLSMMRFLNMAFMHRRKTLRYNLKRVLGPRHLDIVKNLLGKEGITLDHRAEIVPVPIWGVISNELSNNFN